MKIRDKKILKHLWFLVLQFVVVAVVANCNLALANNMELPGFKGLEQSKKLNLQDWISVKYFGPEDKPMQEFVIAFTTGVVSINTTENVSVVSLPKVEMLPMIKFIQTKGNSEFAPNYKEGMFRVQLYSRVVVKQTYYMDRDQSLSFFNYLNVIMRRHTELNEKSKYGFERTLNFLNRLKKQGLK